MLDLEPWCAFFIVKRSVVEQFGLFCIVKHSVLEQRCTFFIVKHNVFALKTVFFLDVYAIKGVYATTAARWLAAEQNPAVNHKRYCVRP